MNLSLSEIRHDQAGFEALVCLLAQTKGGFFDDIDINMSATAWFDADMCAAFGAILYRLGENLNTVKLKSIPPNVEGILSKNGFLSHYGREKIPDRWGTTIPYKRFDVKDDRYFAGYIETEFIHRREMPDMSSGLLKKFRESIFEIFSNAVLHSRTTQGIFSCGQFFPKRNRLDFSVADLGVGIRQNIQDNIGLILTSEEAIAWATQERNTTKKGPIPGGLGLKLLREFIDLNGGYIQIVSDSGYWRRAKGQTSTALLSHPFPGTVVSIEINTADTQSYVLSSELSEADIF
ncbi:MAG: ATP-binding protein [Deltaproteobacteria bacterium]|nr:MAG: ATP-binding protein [Deltaproteobacteria bacterium]